MIISSAVLLCMVAYFYVSSVISDIDNKIVSARVARTRNLRKASNVVADNFNKEK